jgi:NTP pyrophosphatase (non-canonical NTP hydrolase)
MNTPSLDPALALAALEKWGLEAQLRQLQEECAELIAAVNHLLRGRDGAVFSVAEEMADVRIVLDQCWSAFESSDGYMKKKVDRLQKRLGFSPDVS